MMRLARALSVLLGLIILGACAAPASRDAMDISPTDQTLFTADRYLTGKVTVGRVIGGQATNRARNSGISNIEFEAALRNSLETAYLFSPGSKAEFELDAELIEIDQPRVGFTLTVGSKIRYQLRDLGTRQTLLDEVIVADGTASTDDSSWGVDRLKIATERSAQANIQQIIDALYNFDKP